MRYVILLLMVPFVTCDLLSTYSSTGDFGRQEIDKERERLNRDSPEDHPGEWILTLKEGVDPEELASKYGLTYNGHVKGLPNFHLFVDKDIRVNKRLPDTGHFVGDVDVQSFHVQHQKRRFKRGPVDVQHITDPMFHNQWHLKEMDAENGWKERDGERVVIAIVDDGLEGSHPDLSSNFRRDLSFDFNGNDNDPSPYPEDGHGTSAAGTCCAASNLVCGLGVAPEADVVGIRLIADPVADYQEAQALSHENDKIHIYSNSWGPYDDGKSLEGPGPVTREMFRLYANQGRGGLGSIWVWAGGNGRANGDNCNYDGYANNRFTIAVGALGHDGRQAWYSEDCAALFVTSPSSGSTGWGIQTTDLTGSKGYDWGDCTQTFGGTSAAAPMVAGAIALLLEERSDLTWRDVQHVLAKSSKKVDAGDNDWTTNQRGYHHNHKYGFGKVNLPDLLNIGKAHQLVPSQKSCTSGRVNLIKVISQGGFWTWQPIAMPSYHCTNPGGGSDITFVEHIELNLYIQHPRRGRVEIILISPENVKSVLAEVRSDDHYDYPPQGWTYTSVRHWGEQMRGEWNVGMKDSSPASNYKGRLRWFEFVVYGY